MSNTSTHNRVLIDYLTSRCRSGMGSSTRVRLLDLHPHCSQNLQWETSAPFYLNETNQYCFACTPRWYVGQWAPTLSWNDLKSFSLLRCYLLCVSTLVRAKFSHWWHLLKCHGLSESCKHSDILCMWDTSTEFLCPLKSINSLLEYVIMYMYSLSNFRSSLSL